MNIIVRNNYIAGFILCIVSSTGWANSGTEHAPTYVAPSYPSWPTTYDGGPSYNATDPTMPYAGSTCDSCHGSDAGYSGTSSLSGELAPAPGEVNSYTLGYTSNAVENGFSLTVKNSQGSRVGQFTSVGTGVKNHSITGVNTTTNNHITHNTPKVNTGSGNWTFSWKAPSGVGAIGKTFTMYWCINQVNADGDAYTSTGAPNYFTLDGPPICDTRNIVVTNTPPNATDNTTSTTENLPVDINVKLDGTPDDDGDPGLSSAQTLTVTAVAAPSNPAPNGTTLESGVTDGLVTYDPNGQFDSLAAGASTTDVFQYTLSDGLITSTGNVTVTVTGVNDIPVIAVDASTGYMEASPAVVIDPSITISDVDTGSSINGAEVQLMNNYNSAEDVLACGTTPAGISCAAFDTVSGKLVLSGSQSKVNYELALEAVTYVNTSLNPTVNTRTIHFRVRDDQNDFSDDDTASVAVSSISTPPSSTGFSGSIGFTEGDTVTPDASSAIVLDDSVVLSDPDSDLNQVILEITAGTLVSSEDQLLCPATLPLNGLSCTQGVGKVTLESVGPVTPSNTPAEYQAAIAGVKYNNISNNPDTSDRTVELFVRDSSNTPALSTPSKTITIAVKNDSPTSINVPAILTATEESQYVFTFVAIDPDDLNDGSGLTYSIASGAEAGMAVNNTAPDQGTFTWTPPRTNTFNDSYNLVMQAVDGGENASVAVNTPSITLEVSPPDLDGDGVADYADNCPGNANGAAEDNQADYDGDTQYISNAGFPAIGDVDTSDPTKGGDACDTDDDNDNISDVDELLYPGCLDPFNAADATEDCDGDGIDNITEVNDGNPDTEPDEDSVAPLVTAPADITVDATGLLTVVNLGKATGNDGNDGATTQFKAAVNLSAAELAALDDTNTGCQAYSNFSNKIKPFRPGSHNVTWATCDSAGNSGRDNQIVNVKPLVSVTPGQAVGEGQAVNVNVVLNGKAIAYPASVKYTVSGTANVNTDHDGVAGTVTFSAPGDVGVISFNSLTDGITEADETVVITLHTPVNVALSNAKVHTVVITEANIAPQVRLSVSQPGAVLDVNKGNALYQADGLARVTANAIDGNGDTLAFNWSGTDASVLAIATVSTSQLEFDPGALMADELYKVSVIVSDSDSSITVDRLLHVKLAEAVPLLLTDDTDDDGIDDLAEGFGDDDGDGIANYLDNVFTPPNAVENNTANLNNSVLIETDPGLFIALGETAIAAQASGVSIGLQDIKDYGGAGGVAVTNAETEHAFFSSLFNFEITGLNNQIESVHVVLPLSSAIQADSVYRKYNSTGWFDFVIDDKNEVRSAKGKGGTCPQPGSNLYLAGLNVGDLCLQLTIQDGGSNDADAVRNFVVKDPGGLALVPEPETVEADPAAEANGRIGTMSLWFIAMLTMAVAIVWRSRRQCIRRK